MKCPKCGADSSVLETRKYMHVMLRRRRQCFNEHEFQTFEVHAGNLDRRTIPDTVRGVHAKKKAWALKQFVRRHKGLKASEIARLQRVSATRVRQIRASL